MTSHDISLDLFTTPDQLISCQRPFARPPRVLWNEVDEEKTSTIPVLRKRRRPAPQGFLGHLIARE